VGKTQSGVSGYGALAVDNFRDAISGDLELARESGGAHIEGLQFFGQVLPWMDCDQCHWQFSPSLLMIIDDLDVGGTRRLSRPLKANPPLIVDADAVLAFAISGQRLKTVAGQGGQILQRNGGLQAIQLEARGAFDAGKRFDSIALGEVPGPLVSVADDHTKA